MGKFDWSAVGALLLALSSLGAAQLLAPLPLTRRASSSCPSLHIIAARASLEPIGYGRIGAVVSDVCDQISDCTSSALVYPATLSDYFDSEGAGTQAMLLAIKSFYKLCPDTPMVLMGYSQGANVVGDVICGTSGSGFKETAAISGDAADNIIAVVQMGDPTWIPGLSWEVGNATHDGVVPRLDTASCDPFADRIQSYCDAGDKYCDRGQGKDNNVIHQGYVAEYGADAVKFVLSKYQAWARIYSSSSSSSSSISTRSTSSSSSAVLASTTTSASSSSTSSTSSTSPTTSSTSGSWQTTPLVLGSVAGLVICLFLCKRLHERSLFLRQGQFTRL